MIDYFVYTLYSEKRQKTYTGHTDCPERRIFQHNAGLEKSTKGGAPWSLIHLEKFGSRGAAMKRENELKTGKGRDFLKQFLPGSPPRRTKD